MLLCYEHIIFGYFCDSSIGVNKHIMLNSLHPSQEKDFFLVCIIPVLIFCGN